MKKAFAEVVIAFQFLTRLPIPVPDYTPDALGRAAKYFPLVGLAIGAGGAVLHNLSERFWAPRIAVLMTLTFLVLITGALHEDALADAADGFGGGWNRERVLEIMRDSRIGSYGGVAIALSLLWRFLLLAYLPERRFANYLIAAQVLCRWTTLPLNYLLLAARTDGSAVMLARRTSKTELLIGSTLTLVIAFACLQLTAWLPLTATLFVVLLTAWYYKRRLGGLTGDCFGATNQISEIAVYFCGCAFLAT